MGVKRGIRERAYIFLKLLELFIAACIVVMVLVLMAVTLKEYLIGNVSLYDEEALNIFLQTMLSFAVAGAGHRRADFCHLPAADCGAHQRRGVADSNFCHRRAFRHSEVPVALFQRISQQVDPARPAAGRPYGNRAFLRRC